MADEESTTTTGKRGKEGEGEGGGGAGETAEPLAKRARDEQVAEGAGATGGEDGNAASQGASAGGAADSASAAAGSDLLVDRPATKAKLEWLYKSGKISADEMTQSTLLQLREFSDSKGVEIVEQFAEADLAGVRNKAGFFGGVIKRYREMQAAPAQLGAAAGLAQAAVLQMAPQGGGVMWPSVQAKLDSMYNSGVLAKGELDQRCLDQLKVLSETSALEVVTKFSEADLATIKSKGGFFMGIVKRFKEQERGVFASLTPAQYAVTPLGAMALQGQPRADLWPSAKAKLDAVYATGLLQPGELDSRCMEQLRSLPEYLALEVVTKFSEADLGTIKSKGGFFMGIIKRFKEQVVAADPHLTTQTYSGLPYMVQAKLEGLFSTNLVHRHELDAKCFIELRQLPEMVALEVLPLLTLSATLSL